MTLYLSHVQQVINNVIYAELRVIESVYDLVEVLTVDHSPVKFRDNYRKDDNFMESDTIIMDCDDGAEIKDISVAFPDVHYFIVPSKSHMKPKHGKVAPRFHVYFPLSAVITESSKYRGLKYTLWAFFPAFDKGALCASQPTSGVEDPCPKEYEGTLCVDEFLESRGLWVIHGRIEDMSLSVPDIIEEGERDVRLYSMACSALLKWGDEDGQAYSFFQECADRCSPLLPQKQVDEKWQRALLFYERRKNDKTYVSPNRVDNSYKSSYKSTSINLRTLSETKTETVDWLVPGYIPRGQITLLAGDGGAGKTSLWCNLAASITRGEKSVFDEGIGNPFWTNREPGRVLFFSAEDSVPKVLKGRLKDAGADESMIQFLDLTDENFKRIMFDSEELKQLVRSSKPQLCIFDPLQSFIPGSVQMGSRNQMRQCLSPLIGLGEEYGTTFLIVLHTNKKMNVSGRMRIADSADIWDIARSVLIAGRADGKHYLSHEKCNYGELADTILFSINDGGVLFEGTTDKRDRDFVLDGVREMNRTIAPIRSGVKDYILDYLSDGEPHETKNVAESVALTGASKKTFDRAKQELKAERRIVFFSNGYGNNKRGYMQLSSE